jgi:glutamine amidotransferase
MCELLALSANIPTDMSFSFRGLRRRGGEAGQHGDGWGLASFEPESGQVAIFREEIAAAFSPLAAQVVDLQLRSHCSIAHIRKATQGMVALENCHPFHRRWQGQNWVFAHNGDLPPGLIPPSNTFIPAGSTDSERAFCWILDALSQADVDAADGPALFRRLVDCSDHLAGGGIFNGLLSNGHWLFVYCGTKLHRLTRRAPFSTATLSDDDVSLDFSTVTTPEDVVTIVSTEPLTRDEAWLPLQPGEALLLHRGELVLQHQCVIRACP